MKSLFNKLFKTKAVTIEQIERLANVHIGNKKIFEGQVLYQNYGPHNDSIYAYRWSFAKNPYVWKVSLVKKFAEQNPHLCELFDTLSPKFKEPSAGSHAETGDYKLFSFFLDATNMKTQNVPEQKNIGVQEILDLYTESLTGQSNTLSVACAQFLHNNPDFKEVVSAFSKAAYTNKDEEIPSYRLHPDFSKRKYKVNKHDHVDWKFRMFAKDMQRYYHAMHKKDQVE